MSDETVPGQEPAAPASSPAPVTLDQIRQLIAEGMDSRVSGIQSVFDKQLSAIRKDIQKSQLAPDEIEAEERSELQQQLAQAQRVAAAATAALKHPDLYPVYDRLMNAASADEQFAILQEFRGAGQSASGSDPSPETSAAGGQPTPPIDPNRPPRNVLEPYNGPMTRELADAILSAATEWPREG